MKTPLSLHLLRVGFWLLGSAAVLIGLSNVLFGIATTGAVLSAALVPFGIDRSDFADLAGPNADNEFRFYSVLWIAYGVALVDTARKLPGHFGRVLPLILVFLVGGIARILSVLAVGPPHPLFVLLMYVELVMSVALLAAWFLARNRTTPSPT